MDYKKICCDMISRYPMLQIAAVNLTKRIEDLQKRSSDLDCRAEAAVLMGNLDRTKREITWVEDGLSVLSECDREILTVFCTADRGSRSRAIDEVGVKYGYEKSALYMHKDKALKLFALAVFGAIDV